MITSDGKRRRTHVLRIVLSHSRKAYSEAVFRQTADDFIRCIENAFRHFGGVPRTRVPDNLKAAVIRIAISRQLSAISQDGKRDVDATVRSRDG